VKPQRAKSDVRRKQATTTRGRKQAGMQQQHIEPIACLPLDASISRSGLTRNGTWNRFSLRDSPNAVRHYLSQLLGNALEILIPELLIGKSD
jgi:hypothetical protein